MDKLLYRRESYLIRGAAFDIYKKFRNNHKENIYRDAFYFGLQKQGFKVDKEKRIPVYYEGKKVGTYIPDIVVNDAIFVELKVKPFLLKEDKEQFWYYLKNSGYRLGFLINFGVVDGVQIFRKVFDAVKSSAEVPRLVPQSSAQKGFSLLEFLIYIAVLSVVAMVVASMFLSINRGRGQVETVNEVNSNLRFAAEKISQDLRLASSVSIPALAGATSTTITATVSGSGLTYCVSGGKLRRQVGAGACNDSSEAITNDSVIVDSLVSTRLENTNPILAKTVVSVEVDISVSYNSASPDKQYSGRKKTTISLR